MKLVSHTLFRKNMGIAIAKSSNTNLGKVRILGTNLPDVRLSMVKRISKA